MISVTEALESRRSVRAFLPDPVPHEVLERILRVAARAPSGSNIQPWQVIAVTGAPLRALGNDLQQLAMDGHEEAREFHYYPRSWREPYLARRRKVGWDLYASLGITREEKARMAAQHARNFTFFGAPVGLLFTLDRDMEIGSWLDLGMFLLSVMLAAREAGFDTCPQAALARFPKTIAAQLSIPEDRILVCGMALGRRDPAAPENAFETVREEVEDFTRFLGDGEP